MWFRMYITQGHDEGVARHWHYWVFIHVCSGDTIYTGTKRVTFPGIPSFSPEKFAYIRNPNPSTYKKFQKVRFDCTKLDLKQSNVNT